MKETLVVEFTTRPQLLQAVTTLPEELGPNADYSQGGPTFFARKGRRILPHMRFQIFDDDNTGNFSLSRYFLVGENGSTRNPQERMEFHQALLTGGGIPEMVEVSLSFGKDSIVRFREGLLPNFMQGRYLIDGAHFSGLRGEGWGIDDMTLLVKGGRRSAEVNRLQRPHLPTPNYFRVKIGEEVTGWFNRALEAHRGSFFYAERVHSTRE